MIPQKTAPTHSPASPTEARTGPGAPLARSCPRCGTVDTPVIGPGSGPHTASARCRHCGAFLQWLSTKTPEQRQAKRRETLARFAPSASQRRFLVYLGYCGPLPQSMLEASDAIDALLGKE